MVNVLYNEAQILRKAMSFTFTYCNTDRKIFPVKKKKKPTRIHVDTSAHQSIFLQRSLKFHKLKIYA